MDVYGCIWMYMDVYGCIWMYMYMDVCIWRMFVFMSVEVTVWGYVGMFVV